MPKCGSPKANGMPCERLIKDDAISCYSHDEARAAERHTNASKAAKSKGPVGEMAAVKLQLRELVDGVLDGSVDKGRGSIASQILGTWLRAVEIERKIKETEELEARIEALEGQGEQGGRAWVA